MQEQKRAHKVLHHKDLPLPLSSTMTLRTQPDAAAIHTISHVSLRLPREMHILISNLQMRIGHGLKKGILALGSLSLPIMENGDTYFIVSQELSVVKPNHRVGIQEWLQCLIIIITVYKD